MLSGALVATLFAQTFVAGKVTVEGLRWTSEEFVLEKCAIETGQVLEKTSISEAIGRLYSSLLFSDVEVFGEVRGSDTLDLIVRVTEVPRVGKFEYKAVRKLKRRQLDDTLKAYLGGPLTDQRKLDVVNIVKGLYKKKGYVQAEVKLVVSEPDSAGNVVVTLVVTEGKKFKIGRIDVEGNEAFPDRVLVLGLQNRPLNWWRRILRKGNFDEEKWEEDVQTVREFYWNHGYPRATVDSTSIEYYGKGLMELKLFVTERSKYYFGKATTEGSEAFAAEDILKRSSLTRPPNFLGRLKYALVYHMGVSPRAYSKAKIDRSVADIGGFLADSGYIYASVIPEESSANDSTIDINYRVAERWRVRVREIDIAGNIKTRDNVIRREIVMYPGDYFSRNNVIASQRNLFYLNYFENVTMDIEPLADSSWCDLVFRVAEKSTGQVGAGASYSGIDGFFVNFSLQEPNLFGRGQTGSFLVEWGAYRKNFQIGFTEPWLGGRPVAVSSSIYVLTRYLYTYQQQSTGVNASITRRLWSRYWHYTLGARVEKIRVTSISSGYKGNPFYDFWATHSYVQSNAVSNTVSFDGRNRSFNAFAGVSTSYTNELVGGPLGGGLAYIKHLYETEQYKAFGKFVTMLRAKGGNIFGLIDGSSTPFYEYFALGDVGPLGLRGYDYRSVGTRSGGVVIGGRHYFILTLEERLRLSETFYLLTFFDAGNSWWSLKTVDLATLKRGAGVGVRLEMPILGVIGFDFGYGWDNYVGGVRKGQWRPHIQFGRVY